jgi:hypothetical protein
MKTLTLTLFTIIHIAAAAQESEPPLTSHNILKISPQHLLFRDEMKAGIERFSKKYDQSFSFFLTGIWNGDNQENFFNLNKHSGLAAEIQYRRYFNPMKAHLSKHNKNSARGIYAFTFVQSSHHTEHLRGYTYSYNPTTALKSINRDYDFKRGTDNWAIGIGAGVQKKILEVIIIDAFAGAGVQFFDTDITGQLPENQSAYIFNGMNDPGYKGILPKIGIHIGFCL